MKECVLVDRSEQNVCSSQTPPVVIFPLALFLLEHSYTNSKALTGAADFNNAVKDLQSIPYILFVEIGSIFIPLIYHAVYGLVITAEARPNNLAHPVSAQLVLFDPTTAGQGYVRNGALDHLFVRSHGGAFLAHTGGVAGL